MTGAVVRHRFEKCFDLFLDWLVVSLKIVGQNDAFKLCQNSHIYDNMRWGYLLPELKEMQKILYYTKTIKLILAQSFVLWLFLI